MNMLLEATVNDNSQSLSVTTEDFETDVRSLNCSNSLDCECLSSNHALYSHSAVLSCLTLLFNEK